MDRELSRNERRRASAKRLAGGVAVLGVGCLLVVAVPQWLRPSVSRARVRLARVERGTVEAAIEASGTVVPAAERALSSPIAARVEKILKRPGQSVRAGEAVVELDTSAARLEIERLRDRLAQKRNEQAQLRIALERSIDDLGDQLDKARLDLEAATSKLSRDRKLRSDGLVSDEEIHATEIDARKGTLTVEHLAASMELEKRSTGARLDGTALDLGILEKDLAEAEHKLDLAIARCDAGGVVTWVVAQEGTTVAPGEVIARVARLDAFRVEATISDVHASQLRAGLPVYVVVDEQPLAGTLSSVNPAIENGAARFLVDLQDPSNTHLRQNLRVSVFVVTGRHEGVLKVERGPFASGGSVQQVFVVRGDRAVRKPVRFGLSGRDALEVIEGLDERDQVIVSDMQDYLGVHQLILK
jgi:HlyD family secretion protein